MTEIVTKNIRRLKAYFEPRQNWQKVKKCTVPRFKNNFSYFELNFFLWMLSREKKLRELLLEAKHELRFLEPWIHWEARLLYHENHSNSFEFNWNLSGGKKFKKFKLTHFWRCDYNTKWIIVNGIWIVIPLNYCFKNNSRISFKNLNFY